MFTFRSIARGKGILISNISIVHPRHTVAGFGRFLFQNNQITIQCFQRTLSKEEEQLLLQAISLAHPEYLFEQCPVALECV